MASRQDNDGGNESEKDADNTNQNDQTFDAEPRCRDGGRNDATNED
eukprot:CAMPEP_0119552210 /NCGR_PEP_ID=MMETSP1352-20130426/5274_1 /TAXON_ID=265584 /ORGANISM="Stauroneis constricta, Strain CCMP1120" /LENGTH=45 /DNA_ID= /DNA_START= /DNA_END= /DNA_ORIENTATION=